MKEAIQFPSAGIVQRIKDHDQPSADVSSFSGKTVDDVVAFVEAQGEARFNISNASDPEKAVFYGAQERLGAGRLILVDDPEFEVSVMRDITEEMLAIPQIREAVARFVELVFTAHAPKAASEHNEYVVERDARVVAAGKPATPDVASLHYYRNLGLPHTDDPLRIGLDAFRDELAERTEAAFNTHVLPLINNPQNGQHPFIHSPQAILRAAVVGALSNWGRGHRYEPTQPSKIYGLRELAVRVSREVVGQ